MLKALKFVQGAVAKKDFVPALTHFRIRNRMVTGFNGAMAISSPIACDLDISPNASQFIKALAACTETISLHVNHKGRLVVQSGNFQTFVDCDDPANFPDLHPHGETVLVDEGLVPALKAVEPFIAIDASRPWACGVLFNGESIYATNNIILIQYWLGCMFPIRVNIPAMAVSELVRIGDNPISLRVTPNRLIFNYPDGRWLSTQTVEAAWPLDVEQFLSKTNFDNTEPVPAGFWEALELLIPFTDDIGRVYLQGDHMSTIAESELAGSAIAQACPSLGVYNAKHLLNLQGLATEFAWGAYPAAVPFAGERCRGIIAGIRS